MTGRLSEQRTIHGTIILGVDPGTLTTGYGIIEKNGNDVRLLACGAIRMQKSISLPSRLGAMHQEMLEIIDSYHPGDFVIESAFYGKSAQSSLKLGQARGVLILAATLRGIPVSEYSPREIKKAVSGKGSAGKNQVQYMVKKILGLEDTTMASDTSDALAAALCHTGRTRRAGKQYRDWRAFIEQHPELVR